tara:strand:+ start:607 stop:1020 length:414 start_codon:yes stop_codon:yes gene_type:complete
MTNNKRKNKKKSNQEVKKRVIQIKKEMEDYGKIIKMLGDRRVMLVLPDTTQVIGIIPGRFRRRCWMRVEDIVLVSIRDFQKDKVDIIHKFNSSETRELTKILEIPPFFLDNTISATSTNITDDIGFEFSDKLDLDNI